MNLDQWILQNEPLIRVTIFFGLLSLFMGLELLIPKRPPKVSRLIRWSNNIGLVFFNTLLIRLLLPVATIGVAYWTQEQGLGLFNLLEWNEWFEVLLAVIILDCAIYWQHRLFHKVPMLWRLHRVHHVDQDIDVTTGARFHPIEIFMSLAIKFALVCLLGPAAVAVVIFEVLLNGVAMFNHANIRFSSGLDKVLRWFVVTPDMHRVHHSRIVHETNSNFGFNLPWWDRIFGSYEEQPKLGHQNMDIGVSKFDEISKTQYLHNLLVLPFRK